MDSIKSNILRIFCIVSFFSIVVTKAFSLEIFVLPTVMICFFTSIALSIKTVANLPSFIECRIFMYLSGVFVALVWTVVYVCAIAFTFMDLGGEGAMIAGGILSVGAGFFLLLICLVANMIVITNKVQASTLMK